MERESRHLAGRGEEPLGRGSWLRLHSGPLNLFGSGGANATGHPVLLTEPHALRCSPAHAPPHPPAYLGEQHAVQVAAGPGGALEGVAPVQEGSLGHARLRLLGDGRQLAAPGGGGRGGGK